MQLYVGKYKTITDNTLFDDSLPLDDEKELRGQGFQQWRNWKNWIFRYSHRKYMRFYKYIYCKKQSLTLH